LAGERVVGEELGRGGRRGGDFHDHVRERGRREVGEIRRKK
jgi:hypothetical protein